MDNTYICLSLLLLSSCVPSLSQIYQGQLSEDYVDDIDDSVWYEHELVELGIIDKDSQEDVNAKLLDNKLANEDVKPSNEQSSVDDQETLLYKNNENNGFVRSIEGEQKPSASVEEFAEYESQSSEQTDKNDISKKEFAIQEDISDTAMVVEENASVENDANLETETEKIAEGYDLNKDDDRMVLDALYPGEEENMGKFNQEELSNEDSQNSDNGEQDFIDLIVQNDIKQYLDDTNQEGIEEQVDFDEKDYQFEDNRSTVEVQSEINKMEDKTIETENEDEHVSHEQPLKGDDIYDEPLVENNDSGLVFHENYSNLNNDDNQSNDEEIKNNVLSNRNKFDDYYVDENVNTNEKGENLENIDEAKSFEKSFLQSLDTQDASRVLDERVPNEEYNIEWEDDTVDMVYDDLKDDLDTLFKTLDKLTDTLNSESNEKTSQEEESKKETVVSDNENDNMSSNKNDADDKFRILYLNDEISGKNSAEEQTVDSLVASVFGAETFNNTDHGKIAAVDKELSSAELDTLMAEFAETHGEDFDIHSKDFDKHIAPIYISLSVDEKTVITSPNYPDPYPTNNIIDWIFDGEGVGIELNITDFSVNGYLGDYLLVKPGGIDDSGHDGLIFSYHLSSERKYRFLDVNRMFVRFESKIGLAFNRGFSFSVKLVSPLPEEEEESDLPEPESIIDPPEETLLVYLGGLSPSQFVNVSEEFRGIIVDMATMYLNSRDIEYGDVDISEVTQITRVSTCNINWPGFEQCAGVRFGVDLGLDAPGLTAAQLEDMWDGYVRIDPFASRLRRMGIMEFAVPSDSTTLLLWLVIGFCVAVSAGMLALALWRWSCFEGYTRMAVYSDTESVMGQKRPLDLYPTPHQHLPPLYDDDLFKYNDTARVDMGGFANKSFAPDGELYDLESDDDIIGDLPGKRDRFTTDV